MVIGESKTSFVYNIPGLEIDYPNSSISIAADSHSVSFGVFDNFTSDLLHLERHSLLDTELDVIEFPFSAKEVSSLVLTQKGGVSTIVPASIHEKISSADLSRFTGYKPDQLTCDKINTPEAFIYFKKSLVISWLEELFPQSKVQHNAKPLIENMLHKNRFQTGMKIYVDINERSADFLIIRDNKLIKFTSEDFITTSDLLFHIMALVETHEFNQLDDFLFLSGLINNTDEIYDYLKKFLKNIRFNSGMSYQKISKSLGLVPKHQFFTVINAFQCA